MHLTDILPAASTAGLWGLVAAIIVAAIRAEPIMRRIKAESEGRRDGLQAKRITELERRIDEDKRDCDRQFKVMHAQIIVVAHSTMELSSVVEKHDPTSPALARARIALQQAFPINFSTPDDMLAKARKLGGME